jgi:hypothetical protein
VNVETANYIIQYFPTLLTEEEKDALRHSNSMFKLLEPEDYNSIEAYNKKAKWFNEHNLITNDQKTLSLLNEGRELFFIKTAERIVKDSKDKIFFNYCPKCKQLARTPYAKQCKHCGHNWHSTIKASFQVNKIIDLQSIPNLLLFIGNIKSGKVSKGMKIDLTFFGVSEKPIIERIEFIDHISIQTSEVALGVKIDSPLEREYLKSRSLAIPIIIE